MAGDGWLYLTARFQYNAEGSVDKR
jgi:hypothetical protein